MVSTVRSLIRGLRAPANSGERRSSQTTAMARINKMSKRPMADSFGREAVPRKAVAPAADGSRSAALAPSASDPPAPLPPMPDSRAAAVRGPGFALLRGGWEQRMSALLNG